LFYIIVKRAKLNRHSETDVNYVEESYRFVILSLCLATRSKSQTLSFWAWREPRRRISVLDYFETKSRFSTKRRRSFSV